MLTSLCFILMLYSYLNLESTKTVQQYLHLKNPLYSYLNLESTKTGSVTA